jgi:hypothetical protein
MRSWSVIPGGGDEGAVDSQTGLRLSRSPENIRGGFFTWKIFRVVVLGDIRPIKNNPPDYFRDIRAVGDSYFICLAEGPEQSSTHVCLAAKFPVERTSLFPPSFAPGSRLFLCFGGSGGRIDGCPVA